MHSRRAGAVEKPRFETGRIYFLPGSELQDPRGIKPYLSGVFQQPRMGRNRFAHLPAFARKGIYGRARIVRLPLLVREGARRERARLSGARRTRIAGAWFREGFWTVWLPPRDSRPARRLLGWRPVSRAGDGRAREDLEYLNNSIK